MRSLAQSFELLSSIHRARPMPFRVDRRPDGSADLSGYALQWGVYDDHRVCMEPGGFAGPIEDCVLIASHNPDQVIGRCEVAADPEGLFVRARIPADDLSTLGAVTNGQFGGFSADIQTKANPDSRITAAAWDLLAVSLVDFRPAPRRAGAEQGPIKLTSKAELIDHLRASGLSRAAADRVASGGWNALQNGQSPTVDSLSASIEALTRKLNSEIL